MDAMTPLLYRWTNKSKVVHKSKCILGSTARGTAQQAKCSIICHFDYNKGCQNQSLFPSPTFLSLRLIASKEEALPLPLPAKIDGRRQRSTLFTEANGQVLGSSVIWCFGNICLFTLHAMITDQPIS